MPDMGDLGGAGDDDEIPDDDDDEEMPALEDDEDKTGDAKGKAPEKAADGEEKPKIEEVS